MFASPINALKTLPLNILSKHEVSGSLTHKPGRLFFLFMDEVVEILIFRTVLSFIARGVYYLEFRNGQV